MARLSRVPSTGSYRKLASNFGHASAHWFALVRSRAWTNSCSAIALESPDCACARPAKADTTITMPNRCRMTLLDVYLRAPRRSSSGGSGSCGVKGLTGFAGGDGAFFGEVSGLTDGADAPFG